MDPYLLIDKYYEEGELRKLLLLHSELVRDKALEAVYRSGLTFDEELLTAGALLHDIGIYRCDAPTIYCVGTEPYIRHGIIGADLLRKEGYPELARFCERHTGAGLTKEEIITQALPLPHQDFLPETIEEKAVCYADKFFSKSGDPTQEKSLDNVLASLSRHGAPTLSRFLAIHSLFSY